MITLGFLEEDRFSQFELKLESAGISAFSNKTGFKVEAELEFCTILADLSE